MNINTGMATSVSWFARNRTWCMPLLITLVLAANSILIEQASPGLISDSGFRWAIYGGVCLGAVITYLRCSKATTRSARIVTVLLAIAAGIATAVCHWFVFGS